MLSKYNRKKHPKVTYLLGAGASYSSVPIWSEQGNSMLQVAGSIESVINKPSTILTTKILESSYYCGFNNKEKKYLLNLVSNLKWYAGKIESYGTIDSYAYQLHNRSNKSELAKLKKTLSIYLDIWQFYESQMNFRKSKDEIFRKKQTIDTRYFNWLNMITQSDNGNIHLHKDINILSWNYDLQVELAYAKNYDDIPLYCLNDINKRFKFVKNSDNLNKELSIHHLNGHHGYFKYGNEEFPTGRSFLNSNIYSYLKDLNDNLGQFKIRENQYHDYNKIKFSWERGLPENIIDIARNTDILVIIGYSFPVYNSVTDRSLIDAFKENEPMYVYYQDPISIDDKVKRIKNFINFDNFQHDRSIDDFFIPDEFINPKSPQPFTF